MSPDVFLSQHGIRYNMYPGTPAEVVANLKLLNKTRTLESDGTFRYVKYQSPSFTTVPGNNPNSFDPAQLMDEFTAVQAYEDARRSGSLAAVYRAVDAINAIRSVVGGWQFQPDTNFDILGHQSSQLGETVRILNSQRVESAIDGTVLWFDQPTAYADLQAA